MSWRSIFIEGDDAWPGLRFNPARGDAEAIADLAADMRFVGRELDELHDLISKAGNDNSFWTGDAADAFRGKLGELPTYLEQGTESMQACGKALLHWHDTLASLQKRGDALEAEAVPARREWDRLARAADEALRQASMPEQTVDAQQAAAKNANAAGDEAQAAREKLESLIRQGEDVYNRWSEAAKVAAAAVRNATELAPAELGFWSSITKGLKDAVHNVTDWLVDNADTLSTISSGLALAAVAVQAIPVVGQAAGAVLGTGAVLCSAGALVGHWVGMRRGNGAGVMDLAGDALGLIPGAGLAKGGFKAGTAVVKGGSYAVARNGVKAAQQMEKAADAAKVGGKAVATKLRSGVVQQQINKAAVPLAKRFGVDLSGSTLHSFEVASQTVIRGGSFAHKLMPDGGERTATGAPSSSSFYSAIAS